MHSIRPEELYQILRQDLENFAPGSKFYSVREIMRKYSCNLRVVNGAISKLKEKKLIHCEPHVGMFNAMRESSRKRHLLYLAPDWPSRMLQKNRLDLQEEVARSKHWLFQSRLYDAENNLPLVPAIGLDAICINKPSVLDKRHLMWLQHITLPLVLTDCRVGDISISSVNVMDEFAGFLLAKYLFDRGHRRILLFNAEPVNSSIALRKQGMRNFASLSGIRLVELDCKVQLGEYAVRKAYETLSSYLAETHGSFTALAAMSSGCIPGIYRALGENGLKIPDDVSVAGCDYADDYDYVTPMLSGIGVEGSFAEAVLDGLDAVLDGKVKHFHTELRPYIMERNSVAAPSAVTR